MITDYGRRAAQLETLTKLKLANLISDKCGMYPSVKSRTKTSLVQSVLRMEEHRYDEDGMLKHHHIHPVREKQREDMGLVESYLDWFRKYPGGVPGI